MIAHLCGTSINTVSRAVTSLHVESIDQASNYNKRYNIVDVRKITSLLYAGNKKPIHQKINVFYNFKGGTGKTSICYQVATHLALLGFKVLALDLDPQAHLSLAMQVPEDYQGPTIFDILVQGSSLQKALLPIFPGLDLLPANISMTRIEVPLSGKTKREEKLLVALEPVRELYDYIVIDTNPTISTLNMNALVASDRVNIVCETQPFSLSGLRVLMAEMMSFYEEMKINPNFCIIPNKYEIKTATAQEVLGAIRTEYGDSVISAVVRKAEEINIAAKKKLPLSGFCKMKSVALEDIMDLTHELVKQTQNEFVKYNSMSQVSRPRHYEKDIR
ncbi:MAG: ParA family protein [Lutibacter sp.]